MKWPFYVFSMLGGAALFFALLAKSASKEERKALIGAAYLLTAALFNLISEIVSRLPV